MTKILTLSLALFICITACSPAVPPAEAPPPQAAVPDALYIIPVDDPENFILYSYHYAGYNSSMDSCFVPLKRSVPAELDVAALNTLLRSDEFIYADRFRFQPDRANLEFTIKVVGDLLTIDLDADQFTTDDEGWVGGRSQGLRGLAQAEIYTLWATIRHNCINIKRVRVLEGGLPYVIADTQYDPVTGYTYTLGYFTNYPAIDEEGFIIDIPLVLPAYSREELALLRAKVPLPEQEFYTDHYGFFDDWPPPFFNDPLGRRLSAYLNNINIVINRPQQSFTSIEEADPRYLTDFARFLTPFAPVDNIDLVPLHQTVCSPYVILKEHVEHTALLLFGEGIELQHGSGSNNRYDEYGGTYTWVSAIGFEDLPRPVIVDLQEQEDRYELTVVYASFVSYGPWMGGYYRYDADYSGVIWLQGDELMEHFNSLPQHRLILLKQPDDHVTIYGYILPD